MLVLFAPSLLLGCAGECMRLMVVTLTILGDGHGKSGKSYLFFLTARNPGISLTGEGVPTAGKVCQFLMHPEPSCGPLKI